MKSILIIGLGRFGKQLARKLIELDNEVMIVDRNEENLSELLPIVTDAHVADCTKREVLLSLGVTNFDYCFVCMGSDFQSSLETTSLLKELGAKHVISKADRDIHIKFLLKNGADEVIDPERDAAERMAVRYSADNLFDYIGLTKEVAMYEIEPMDAWLGKSIKQLRFRNKYNVSILATKSGNTISPLPSADYVFAKGEHLIILGQNKDVKKILKRID